MFSLSFGGAESSLQVLNETILTFQTKIQFKPDSIIGDPAGPEMKQSSGT